MLRAEARAPKTAWFVAASNNRPRLCISEIKTRYLELLDNPITPVTVQMIPQVINQIVLLVGEPVKIREKAELADCAE